MSTSVASVVPVWISAAWPVACMKTAREGCNALRVTRECAEAGPGERLGWLRAEPGQQLRSAHPHSSHCPPASSLRRSHYKTECFFVKSDPTPENKTLTAGTQRRREQSSGSERRQTANRSQEKHRLWAPPVAPTCNLASPSMDSRAVRKRDSSNCLLGFDCLRKLKSRSQWLPGRVFPDCLLASPLVHGHRAPAQTVYLQLLPTLENKVSTQN